MQYAVPTGQVYSLIVDPPKVGAVCDWQTSALSAVLSQPRQIVRIADSREIQSIILGTNRTECLNVPHYQFVEWRVQFFQVFYDNNLAYRGN